MAIVIGVKFKESGRVYYFDPGELAPQKGALAVVETSRGVECGEVVMPRTEVEEGEVVKPLKKLVRMATDADRKRMEENRKREVDALRVCQKKADAKGLEMKVVDVEYAFDGSKILFYFTADGRVDFRELVKDLASVFRTRIELRQIGVRDEAKMLGGLGICGQPFCCSRFLNGFQPVSIKMAKEQGLSLNPTKISGSCGRLMCCLKYEQNAYEYLNKITPRNGSIVETPEGRGIVVDASPLTGRLKVRVGEEDAQLSEFSRDEVKLLQPPKGKGKPAAAREKEKEK
ncbi:MAG: PSP1 domain-containing protein [Candidatus Howiella sp.]